MAQYWVLCFLISSAQCLTLEPAIPAVCLRQAWHCHTRTKTSSVVARENREILSLKCYCCSDPAQQLLWKVSRDSLSVTAKMSNLKHGLPAARKWQTGSLFSSGCLFPSATSSRAPKPQGGELDPLSPFPAEDLLLYSNVLLTHSAGKQVHMGEHGCLACWFEHSHGSLRFWTLLPGLFMHFTRNSHQVTYNPRSKPSGDLGKATPSFWILISLRCELGWAAWPCQDWDSSGHAWR